MSLGNYDAWKCREPDEVGPAPDNERNEIDDDGEAESLAMRDAELEARNAELTDSAIELLLEDARLGDSVESVTLVEACETALGDGPDDEVAGARLHICEYLRSK